MPAGKAKALKGARQASPASCSDRIGALPDEILHRVLSFLPARQAVQTCVLARRWRYLWKSAIGLRIVHDDGMTPVPLKKKAREFVNSLLLLRGSSPLETFELRLAGAPVSYRKVRLWVSYAVQCKIQVLRLSFHRQPLACLAVTELGPEDPPLASSHLTKLEIHGLTFNKDFLDFSRCPKLQDLKITDCIFKHAKTISSKSLMNLSIERATFNRSSRARIFAPNLASLRLQVISGRTPVLEKMPLLANSYVAIFWDCKDCCNHSNYGDCGDESCEGCIRDDSASVILHGMSQAKSLSLLAFNDKFIFRRDLKLCPTFNRLKFLTLNENLCVPDEHPLACILEHSPVLEELNLSLYFKLPEVYVEMKGRFNPNELPSTISSHLKKVEITCGQFDGTVLKVLKFLSELNISFSFTEYKLKAEDGSSAT